MILYLTHGNGEESIPLKLPASSSQVDEIDIRLDDICSGEGNFRISDVKSSVKGLWQFIRSADLLDPEDLEKLNRLSRQIDAMSEKEHQIFAGALLSECISNLDDVLQTVGRIGQYGMIPEVTCDRELGWYLVEHGKIDCPEHLKPYLDYVGIGAEFYSNCGGAYTLDGYVVRKEHLSNHSQVPEPWRNENRDEMLRMILRVDGKPDYILVLPADEEYLDAVKAYANKHCAEKIYIPTDLNHNSDFVVRSHPAVLDGFVSFYRKAVQALNLFGAEHCVGDRAEQDYTGKVLVLSPDTLKESCWSQENQLWYAHDGFGCSPHAIGRSVRCTCLSDGEMTRWNRSEFIGVLDDKFLPEWAKPKLAELQAQEQTDAPTMGSMNMK